MLATKLLILTNIERKRMEWELKIKDTGYPPEKGKLTVETVKPPNDKPG